jgi:hypothetical protein
MEANMATRDLPPTDQLRKMLRYESETGKLYWRNCESQSEKWNNRCAGKEALKTDCRGYLYGKINGKPYYAHRIIWKLVYGVSPREIDHINGIKFDNRLRNLRECSHAENHKNRPAGENNSSGCVGVHWRSDRQKWQARIFVDGKSRSLGLYENKDSAISARAQASKIHGYHRNHGR